MYKKFLRTLFIIEFAWCIFQCPANAVLVRWQGDESGAPWTSGRFQLTYENYWCGDDAIWKTSTPGSTKYVEEKNWTSLSETNTEWCNERKLGRQRSDKEAFEALRRYSSLIGKSGNTINEAKIWMVLHRDDGMYWATSMNLTQASEAMTEKRAVMFRYHDGKSQQFRPRKEGCSVM
jgi:hypothetical protein